MDQRAEVFPTQGHTALITGWPGEPTLLQPLGTDPQPGAVPVEHLEPIASPIGEHEQVTRERIVLELLDHQAVEPIETTTQIHRRGRHQHPRGPRHIQHGRAPNSCDRCSTSPTSAKRTVQPRGWTTSWKLTGTWLLARSC